jgi:hypothetical protein
MLTNYQRQANNDRLRRMANALALAKRNKDDAKLRHMALKLYFNIKEGLYK